jgi:hypothetical protein
VAFWPVPDQSAPETAELQRITLSLWQAPLLPKQLATFESGYREFCTWACPQRAVIGLVTIGVFVLLVALVSFSYYSGTVDKIAFKWYAAHLSVVFVLLALLVLTTCDPAGAAPPWLLLAFLATLLLLSFADFIQRMRNGPKP